MFKQVTPLIIYGITPIHAGTGRELGLIDMPIQKEQHSGIPKIEGSTVKGSLRCAYRMKVSKEEVNKLFGPESGNQVSGMIGFTDAKLLFYPIRALDGLFAYVTCPYLVERFFEDMNLTDNSNYNERKYEINDGECVVLNLSKDSSKNEIILDEYSFELKNDKNQDLVKLINENSKYKNLKFKENKNIVIISDGDFKELIEVCKDIITRNRISIETGTVDEKSGGIFTEEYLPSESILYTLLLLNGVTGKKDCYDDYKKTLNDYFVQIGGNENIGKGLVRIHCLKGSEN